MRTRCLDCRDWATRGGRCDEHYRAREAARSPQSHSKRKQAIANGTQAARRLRAALRRAGWATCARCGLTVLPSAVDVDHIKPLSQGGTDTDSNVQALCRPCHRLKTKSDIWPNSAPF